MWRIKNLNKNYGDFSIAVKEWNLSMEGVTVLWGESGAGKTSLIRLLSGLEDCEGLSWKDGERDLAQLPPHERGVSLVFQHLALFPHLTARENINFPLLAQNKEIRLQSETFLHLCQLLELDGFLDKKVNWLSGGQKQRVALARALMTEPQLLILDEPFTSLDYQLKIQARLLVQKIVQEQKIAVLLVSHDPEDVRSLAQRVVILEKGKIKAELSLEDFETSSIKSNIK